MAASLGNGELRPLAALIEQLGLTSSLAGDAVLHGADPVVRSPHRLGEAVATAQLLIGVAGMALWQARSGERGDVSVDIIDALHSLHPSHFVQQQGRPMNVGAEFVVLNRLYRCKDGRQIMFHAGPPYPKLLKGFLDFFDCGNNPTSIGREVAKWDSAELEDALAKAGLPACRAFSPQEWRNHPQGQAIAKTPVIEIEKIADGPAVPFAANGHSPLDGIRVLDFTHVLAGPRSTRTLAEFGADVLHISSPSYPDTLQQHLGVDVGKRCAYLDLGETTDLACMHELARTADIFATSYRGSVNERFGLLPHALAQASERGIVCMSANAYGHTGPWAGRGGFDQNAQVNTGIAWSEGAPGDPRFTPVFYLNDLMMGYFAAAGMLTALLRRATEGGSYHVKLSLSRSAMWVQDLGYLDVAQQQHVPEKDTYPAKLSTIDTAFGKVSFLEQALRFSHLTLPESNLLMPLGATAAQWL